MSGASHHSAKSMKYLLSFLFLAAMSFYMHAQNSQDSLAYSLNTQINAGAGNHAPFLSTANQYDRFSLTPNSLSTWAAIKKTTSNRSVFDYGFAVELNSHVSPSESQLFASEMYVEAKVGPLLTHIGMKRETFGNQDSELSSGGFLFSKNSRPIPALTFETDGWFDVPLTQGFVSLKGGMANGWFSDETLTKNTLMHHKWLHVKLGGSRPLTFNYGLHHVAQWAGKSPTYGTGIVNFENFKKVFLGQNGSANDGLVDFYNALGNHIISQNLGFDLNLKNCSISLYWQNLNEDKPVLKMNNAYNKEDGLFGVSLRLPRFKPLHSLAIELLSTTDQNGPWHDLDGIIYGGQDSYFNNANYPNGWSFYGMTIGNPWLTSPKYNTDGWVGLENNCVRLFYLSGMGAWRQFNYRFTTAYSLNWGFIQMSRSSPKRQFSGQLEAFHALPFLKNTEASLCISGDRGAQYGNNLALLLGLRYTGQLLYTKKH